MNDIIKDAFKELKGLQESTFDLSREGIADLQRFLKTDNNSIGTIGVIDPEANTESDLAQNYLGKDTLECSVCHKLSYIDPDSIFLDNDTQLANVGEECPNCGSTEGFFVVGRIAPFVEDSDDLITIKVDGTQFDIRDDSLVDPNNILDLEVSDSNTPEDTSKNAVEENKDPAEKEDKVLLQEEKGSDMDILELDEQDYDIYKGDTIVDSKDLSFLRKGDKLHVIYNDSGEEKDMKVTYKDKEIITLSPLKEIKEGKEKKTKKVNLYDEVSDILSGAKWYTVPNKVTGKPQLYIGKMLYSEVGGDDDSVFVWIGSPEEAKAAQVVADHFGLETKMDAPDRYVKGKNIKFHIYVDPEAEVENDKDYWLGRELHEDFQNATIETKKNRLNISSTESGKVSVTSEPRIEDEDVGMIVPLDDEEKDAVIDNVEEENTEDTFMPDMGEPVETEEEPIEEESVEEEVVEEEPIETMGESLKTSRRVSRLARKVREDFSRVKVETEDQTLEVNTEDSGKIQVESGMKSIVEPEEDNIDFEEQADGGEDMDMDIEIEDFDESSFDELGESYLKNVYDNVKSYETTRGFVDDNHIKLEGIITFNSGKKAKTSFLFESDSVTKRGKLRFLGENLQITNKKKSFLLQGSLNNKSLVLESLTYNYNAKDSKSGKSSRVYGTIRRSK